MTSAPLWAVNATWVAGVGAVGGVERGILMRVAVRLRDDAVGNAGRCKSTLGASGPVAGPLVAGRTAPAWLLAMMTAVAPACWHSATLM